MKIATMLSLLFFAFTLLAQGPKNFIDQNYIEVTGKAELEVIPDEIYLDITIRESDSKGKEQLESLEKKMIKALTVLEIDFDKDFAVKDMDSNFKDYWLKRNDIFTTKSYQLIVHNATTLGKVIAELEKMGISNIQIEKVDHSEIEKYRKKVKVKAIKAGKEKAEELALAIDQSIGRALYIREIENYNAPMRSNTMMNVRSVTSMSLEEVPEMQFESIHLEYAVQVYFELK